jgi:4-diphosphocytidyl-2-C-methyl-D-erythritol kinase
MRAGNWDDFVRTIPDSLLNREVALAAPAKINLRLKVLGRRADGYHLLSLLNVNSSLCDEIRLTLREQPGVVVAVTPEPAVPIPTTDNLVTKSWNAFWLGLGCNQVPVGLSAVIEKRIPVGGGLGGGSSDAGAVLRFLVRQFGESLCEFLGLAASDLEQRVMRAALAVGADVPYAYHGGVCWVTGVGEEVHPLQAKRVWPGEVLISVPGASVPTASFYAFFRQRHPHLSLGVDEAMLRVVREGLGQLPLDLIENDFESDVCAFRPAVGRALAVARESFPATTSVTGSGAALFSLVPPEYASRVPAYIEHAAQENITVHRTTVID